MTRASLRDIEVLFRRALGPTIPKKKAAAVLGISVPALDRWVNRGPLPVVAKPGSSRLELESRAFLELAGRVETVTDELGEVRTQVSVAIKRLGWTPTTAGRRVLRLDVASLPRPSVSERALVAGFRSTTPEARVRQVAELSRMFAPAPPERPSRS